MALTSSQHVNECYPQDSPPYIHFCPFFNEEMSHFSPPMKGCQVEGCVAKFVPCIDRRRMAADQEPDNSSVQVRNIYVIIYLYSTMNTVV